jgi:hypothetical protein
VELKGFINTLEAVLASSFLLFLALVAAPQLATDNQLESRETLQQAADTLQMGGEPPQQPAQVDSELAGLVPPGLRTRTTISQYSLEERRVEVSGGQQNVTVPAAPFAEAQLFVDSAPSLNLRFNGTDLAALSPGYRRVELPGYGNLTFDGSGRATVAVLSYDQSRSSGTPEGTRFSASVFATENGTREVTVEAWRG